MTTAAEADTPRVELDVEVLSVDELLDWGDKHPDPEVADQATRARAAFEGLRHRHTTDRRLFALEFESTQLERRLAELQAQRAALAPRRPKGARGKVDYPAATVRAWAAANGMPCPRTGRVPDRVVKAWRQTAGTAE
ncbi:hypothetical protein ACIRH0_03835 [Streptomyces sp. NPDC093675]|uniref:Lsr2 family DNA-binding protein n=1 Tax=Streptomyces sp. NPDC093675 TaxID=3366049 RepID=UPI00382A7A5D